MKWQQGRCRLFIACLLGDMLLGSEAESNLGTCCVFDDRQGETICAGMFNVFSCCLEYKQRLHALLHCIANCENMLPLLSLSEWLFFSFFNSTVKL